MTNCPPPKEIQDFIFKQANIDQVCEGFQNVPICSSLIAVDGKRGLLYIGHNNKLFVIKSGAESNPEWKLELDLPDRASRVQLSCDYSFLAITFSRASALIYDASSIQKHTLDVLHEIRLSSGVGNVVVTDFKWNPAIPEMLCSVTNDHTVGCFQVSRDKKVGVQILGMEKPQGLEAVCVSWSPKGKQLVIGCKNGDIVQLKPELKIARHLTGPNPSEGVLISILWISNYQFCACYFHADEQRISVMIVDAPKGVTAPKYTNYEDITYGSGSMENLCYTFEYITEWGIIIAASSHSSEVAVLGTSDNAATWNLWQLMEGSTVQLPLNRKKGTENYPVGLAIDKTATQKLPWGTDGSLPNPVPVLRILVTSGQLCNYHVINLKEKCPSLCSPPTEIIPIPPQPRPSMTPSEVSFNISNTATSTPRIKQTISEPRVAANVFADNPPNSNFSFSLSDNKSSSDTTLQAANNATAFPIPKPTGGLFGRVDQGKTNLFQPDNKVNKPLFTPQPVELPKSAAAAPITQSASTFSFKLDNKSEQKTQSAPALQQEPKSIPNSQTLSTFAFKLDNKTDPKPQSVPLPIQQLKEPELTPVPQRQEEPKGTTPSTKEAPAYDDALCLRAYYEEQAKFEKELKSKLDLPNWHCGTDEERNLLVKKTEEIDEFQRELKETTNSLASDIAYLKALLLQSFAWIEESKSKNSANVSITGRNRTEGSKLADLQRLYYYTQSQLIQATKVLDLEWAEHKNREVAKMRIPSLEVIYQSLIRHTQIIAQEKKNLEDLIKKWRKLSKGNTNASSLDRSMANLSLSQSNTQIVTDAAIDMRCKLIATNVKNFSREKQTKLRDLLSESAPMIVRAVRPTAVQDRLEATLSSLASLKNTENASKNRVMKTPEKPKNNISRAPIDTTPKSRGLNSNALSSLDNLVSDIGGNLSGISALSKSPSSTTAFSALAGKPASSSISPPKENMTFSFSLGSGTTGQEPAVKPFSKMDTISFGTIQQTQQPSKDNKAPSSEANNFSMFPANTFGRLGSPDATSGSSPISNVPKSTFSFSSSSGPTPSFASVPNAPVFKFSTTTPLPPAPGSLDLSSMNFGSRSGLTITPVSETKTSSPAPSLPSTFSFGKGSVSATTMFGSTTTTTTPIFGSTTTTPTTNTTAASQPADTQVSTLSSMFGKSAGVADKPVAPISSKAISTPASSIVTTTSATSVVSTATTTSSTFGTSTLFGALNSSTTSPFTFNTIPVSTQQTSQAVTTTMTTTIPTTATAATTTTSSAISFGGLSSTTATTSASALPSFTGILGATANMSFGSASTGASITPAFGKTTSVPATNIFGNSTATAITAAASTTSTTTPTAITTSSIFGKPADSTVSSTMGNQFGTTTPTATTTSSSVFSSATATTGKSLFGGQTTVSTTNSSTQNSFFSSTIPATATVAATAATTVPVSPIFGGAASTTPSSIFGNSNSTTPAFGTAATAQPSNIFGTSTTQSSGTSVFGGSSTAAVSSTPVFGGTSTIASPVFGGTSTTTTASSIFNSAASTTTTSSIFGSVATTTAASSIFGSAAATSPATTSGSIFGSVAAPTTTASSIFGAGTTGNSIFGGSNATAAVPSAGGSLFGASATPTSSIFGSGTSMFGSSAATTQAGSIFGAATPQPATGGGIFGGTAAASPAFGGAPTMGTGTSMFGGAASPGAMGTTSVFGQSAAFGAKPTFGSPAGSGFATGFGSPPSFGTAPGFGSPPLMGGNTSPLGAASPNSNNVFGSNTFEALGAQTGGLSFGALAQNTPEPEKPPPAFGGSSSFSSWR